MQLTSQKYAAVIGGLRKAAETGGSDKRRFTRIEVQARVSFSVIRPEGGLFPRSSALTRDISMAGCGMMQSADLSAGTEFVIELPTENGDKLFMRCVAKFSRPIANGIFSVGAEFVSEADKALVSHWNSSFDSEAERIRNMMLS